MLKIFSIFDPMFTRPARLPEEVDLTWVRDPLRHPDIARMDTRELGDLPFPGRPVRKVANDHSACPA